MNAPPVIGGPASTDRALRKLFLTLFLRGYNARGLNKKNVPTSVFKKLGLVVVIYAMVGLVALAFLRKPVFALAAYLHAMTLVLLGMFVAASSGEILFNKDESEILLHRPVTARQLLWAKVRVLMQVSLWLAGAFNLVGLFAGLGARDSNWLFPVVHAFTTCAEALFCVSSVVVVYQLCLRWAGRERLESIMTTAQVVIAVASFLASQTVPRMIQFSDKLSFNWDSWWIGILPPAWFAGLDDALAGSGAKSSWLLAGVAFAATLLVCWLAFSRLAADYTVGLQGINEAAPARKRTGGRRLLDKLVAAPPLRWWLRDPVARASFLLTAAYLWRDRDVKLRVYPGIAPMMVMPVVLLLQNGGKSGFVFSSWGVAIAATYLGLAGAIALGLIRYSQQWLAADIFRCAAISGPAQLCHGARRAVLVFLCGPLIIVFLAISFYFAPSLSMMCIALPGLVALPVFAIAASSFDPVIPFAMAPESAQAAERIAIMLISLVGVAFIGGLTVWSWNAGWFGWFLGGEIPFCLVVYLLFRLKLNSARWSPID